MRFANIVFFVIAAALGIILSVAAMWKLPFAIFHMTEDNFGSVIDLLQKGAFDAGNFYAIEALKDVVQWGEVINFVFAVICAILAILPALLTIRLAESKLFERTAGRGWQMIKWMACLGSLAVAILPAPLYVMIYIMTCTLLICGYIITYQWPKKSAKSPLTMPALKKAEHHPHRKIAGEAFQQS